MEYKMTEAEALKSAHKAYLYAKEAIKGRFEEGESLIVTDEKRACRYARNVLNDDFFVKPVVI